MTFFSQDGDLLMRHPHQIMQCYSKRLELIVIFQKRDDKRKQDQAWFIVVFYKI